MHLKGSLSTTYYVIRNNIIANNHSTFMGGGIHIYNANALISNNQIVNNNAPGGSAVDVIEKSPASLCIRNNIFWGNTNLTNTAAVSDNVRLNCSAKLNLKFDHNFIQDPLVQDFFYPVSSKPYLNFLSDTNTNIVGGVPGLIAPTLTSSYTENALTANFGLSPTSICINKGIDSAIMSVFTDYSGNKRNIGSSVDIGAFEYGSFKLTSSTILSIDTIFKSCCMNPASVNSINSFKISNQNLLVIYPNPAKKHFSVQIPEVLGYLELIDVQGRIIKTLAVQNSTTEFNVEELNRGLYFVQWYDGLGGKISQKIIID
jgi:hypothetical protein